MRKKRHIEQFFKMSSQTVILSAPLLLTHDTKRTVLAHANIFVKKGKQAALQAPAFREASYRSSDSLCILKPTAEKKKKTKLKEEEKCFVLFHSPPIPKHSNRLQLGGAIQ